jgi:hypothetical protein
MKDSDLEFTLDLSIGCKQRGMDGQTINSHANEETGFVSI